VFRFLSPKFSHQKIERRLQTTDDSSNGAFGDYKIEKSPNPKGCEDEEKISYDDETFSREIKNMKLFSFARSAVDSWV
jgi:ABC-type multidrug transport system fused ATPase/permease subunit